MSYLSPVEFVPKMADAGERKIAMSTRDVLISAYMAGAMLGIAAVFAITITVQTGLPIVGAIIFPVGFCLLNLMGYDLLTGVFVLTPIAYLAKRRGVTPTSIVRNWFLVFVGNFLGAFTIAVLTSIIFTFGFTTKPDDLGHFISNIGVSRTIGYKEHGAGGMLTIFIRGILCNWMVSLGVVGAMISTTVSGKVLAMWMPITLFFGMTFEHSIVNMYLFPTALILGGDFSVLDYLLWNELPVILGNLTGGLALTGLPLWALYLQKETGERWTHKTDSNRLIKKDLMSGSHEFTR